MGISDRKKKILRAIIESYIETAEPVGSKTLAESAGLGLSSATIRNEMAELTAMGYLEQPHTSAGRVPSAQGYRIYVNELMHRHRLSIEEMESINRSLRSKLHQLSRISSDAGLLTSQLTNYPAYVLAASSETVTISRFDLISVDANTFIIVAMLSNNTVRNKLVRLPFEVDKTAVVKLSAVANANFTNIPEESVTPQLISSVERATGDTVGLVAIVTSFVIETLSDINSARAHVAGASHLLQHPEFRDVDKASRVLDYLSDSDELLKLPKPDESNLKITIGPENLVEELKDSSVIVARYDAGDNMQGLIGVVGPTRMDYSRIAARLSYIANGIGRLLAGGDISPSKQIAEPADKDD